MNCPSIYNRLIEFRKANKPSGYVERHHIVPGSLGGSDDPSNLVYLTAREHYIAHLLLMKMQEEGTVAWIKMVKAVHMMELKSMNQERFTARKYQWFREKFSKAQSLNQSGKGNSQYGKKWFHNPESGKTVKEYSCPLGHIPGRYKIPKVKAEKINQTEIDTKALYKEFIDSGATSLREFVRTSGYTKSHVNLTNLFRKYIPEFNPTQGKKYQVK